MVAVAMTCTSAERSPPSIMLAASGISRPVRICHSVSPWARAASTRSSGTAARPSRTPASRGAAAIIMSTMRAGRVETPSQSARIVSRPSAGSARVAATVLMSRLLRPRLVPSEGRWCPAQRPRGTTMSAAQTVARAVTLRCSSRRTRIPPLPCQLAPSMR